MVWSGLVLGFGPLVALAQGGQTGENPDACTGISTVTDLSDMICKLNDLLTMVIPLLIILAVIYFIWGVITYVVGGDEEAKKEGRNRMIYGIIGLVVIISVWGLVRIVANTLGIGTTQETIIYPTVPY